MNQPTYPIVSTNRWPDEQSYYPQNTYGKILPLTDIEETDDSVDTIIEGILNKGQIALISGPSKSGKSFLVSNFSVSIASGTEMFGKSVLQAKFYTLSLKTVPKKPRNVSSRLLTKKVLAKKLQRIFLSTVLNRAL